MGNEHFRGGTMRNVTGKMDNFDGTMSIIGGTMSSIYGTMRILSGTMSNGKHICVLSRESQILFTKLWGLPLSLRS